MNLYFFYSEKAANGIPDIKTYGNRVRDLLQELVARSNGNLRLSIIDPQPFSDEEDRATELGVRGAPVGNEGTTCTSDLRAPTRRTAIKPSSSSIPARKSSSNTT